MLALTRKPQQSILFTANSTGDFVIEIGFNKIEANQVRICIHEPKKRLKILRDELIDKSIDLGQLREVSHIPILENEYIRLSGCVLESQMLMLRLKYCSDPGRIIVLTLLTVDGEPMKIEVV